VVEYEVELSANHDTRLSLGDKTEADKNIPTLTQRQSEGGTQVQALIPGKMTLPRVCEIPAKRFRLPRRRATKTMTMPQWDTLADACNRPYLHGIQRVTAEWEEKNGAPDRTRTCDFLLRRQTLTCKQTLVA
jgi:hypothetical protein